MNAQEGKALALKLREEYSDLASVEAIFDRAKSEGRFANETEALIVWGRLHKLIRGETN